MSETTAHPTHLREKKPLSPRTVRHTSGHGDDAFDSEHGQNGLHGSCPFPACPQPARWRRLDTRRRLPESIDVCFDHQAADLALLPPLREGNAGPVAASMLMLVDEHPDGISLRDAGRQLRILPTEVARLAKELGLPVLHGKVHRAVAGPSPKEARAHAARLHEQMKPPVIEQLPKRESKPRERKPKTPTTPARKADAPRLECRDRPRAHVGIDAAGLTHRLGGDAPANGSFAETEPPTTTPEAVPACPAGLGDAVVGRDAVVGVSSDVAGDDNLPGWPEGSEADHAAEVEAQVRAEALAGDTDTDEDIDDLFEVDTCARCGCTDDFGCEGGCWWVFADVCSSCATPEELAEAPKFEVQQPELVDPREEPDALAALVTERDPELAEVTERDPQPEPPQSVTQEAPVPGLLTEEQRRLLAVIVEAGPEGIAPGPAVKQAGVSRNLGQRLVVGFPGLVKAKGHTQARVLIALEPARAVLGLPAVPHPGPGSVPRGRDFVAEAVALRAQILEVLTDEWVGNSELAKRLGITRGDRLTRLMHPMIDDGRIETNGKPTSHRKYRRAPAAVAPTFDFDVPKRAAPLAPQRPEPPPPPPEAQERREVAEGPGALGAPNVPPVEAIVPPGERPKMHAAISVLSGALADAHNELVHHETRVLALRARRAELAEAIRQLGGHTGLEGAP